MPNKFLKIKYKIAASIGRGNKSIPIHYHLGRSNFGDDMNLVFFQALLQEKTSFSNQNLTHILGIGSIANLANKNSIVLGSGSLSEFTINEPPLMVLSTRGMLTAKCLNVQPAFFGDLASLSNLLFPIKKEERFKFGIIPHVTQRDNFSKLLSKHKDIKIIDASKNFLSVITEINQCRFIISQSLHGLIIADAYEIPNAWLEPSKNMIGQDYKFIDYFTSLDSDKKIHPIQMIHDDLSDFKFNISKLKNSKNDYIEYIIENLKSFFTNQIQTNH